MSYCRFSSNDGKCDVYVYESERGFETHVASRRYVPAEPMPPYIDPLTEGWHRWQARQIVVTYILLSSPLEPIGLPHDGEQFVDATPGECADRLEDLRDLGYIIPLYAIKNLRDEDR